MSFVFAVPEMVAATASDLASLGAALSEATAAAAIPTTQVLAAAADEVSAAIAELFGAHGQEFQALSAQASAFHDRFVRALSAAAGWYVDAEAANAALVDTAATGASELGSGGRTALILGSTGTPRPPSTTCSRSTTATSHPTTWAMRFPACTRPRSFSRGPASPA